MSDNITNVSMKAALQEAQETFAARNPNSEAAYAKATASMPGGNTRTSLFYSPFPLALVRGGAGVVAAGDCAITVRPPKRAGESQAPAAATASPRTSGVAIGRVMCASRFVNPGPPD